VWHSTYMEELWLKANLQDTFKSRMHSQRLIMNLNKKFCKLQNPFIYPRVKVQWQVITWWEILVPQNVYISWDLSLSLQCCWWFSFTGMWRSVVCKMFPAFLNCFTLKINVSHSFNIFGTTHPVTVSPSTRLQFHSQFCNRVGEKNRCE